MAISHVTIGLGTWTVVAYHAGVTLTPEALGMAMLGSLAPDIDHPRSWLGRRLLFISAPLSALIGHRGLTHSLLAMSAAAIVLALWPQLGGSFLVSAFLVGYLTHLVADLVTNSGIPLLWPWPRRFSIPLANTGGPSEYIIVSGLAMTGWLLYGDVLMDALERISDFSAAGLI